MSNGLARFKWASTVAAVVMVSSVVLSAGQVAYAAEKKQTVSDEVVKFLKPAQDAVQKGDFDLAIAKAKEGLAVSKKPYDKETSLRLLGFAIGKKQDYAAYADVLEQLNTIETVSDEERKKSYKPLAQIYANLKEYDKALVSANKWAEAGGGSEAYGLLATLYLIQKDFKGAIAALEKSTEGREATEAELKQENYCYYTLGDKAKRMAVMELLVAKYPKREYFTDLIGVYQEQNYNERVMLNVYRFGLERDYLSRESEFVDYADIAFNVGAPAESYKVVQLGVDKGIVKLVSATDRNSKLLAQAKAGAAEDRRDIAKQDKEVQIRKNGDADVKLGLAYLSLGDAEKAVEALQRGLSPERMKDVKRVDDAYMTLGISYLRLGKKEEAAKAFTSAQATGAMAKAAALWLLQTN